MLVSTVWGWSFPVSTWRCIGAQNLVDKEIVSPRRTWLPCIKPDLNTIQHFLNELELKARSYRPTSAAVKAVDLCTWFLECATITCRCNIQYSYVLLSLVFCRRHCSLSSMVTFFAHAYCSKCSWSMKHITTKETYQTPGVWNSRSKSIHLLDLWGITLCS